MVDNDYELKTTVRAEWTSDAVADMLRALEVPFVALNPGASYRGLHDSLVNHLGNERPEIVICLHEEHAVAVAHGYAKVTDRPMAAGLHANVGLMHATMALFNAFCDRVPLIAIGATGPVDAAARRPWIDWIHTAADQAAIVRPYVKWDDQPASAAAAVEALARADASRAAIRRRRSTSASTRRCRSPSCRPASRCPTSPATGRRRRRGRRAGEARAAGTS